MALPYEAKALRRIARAEELGLDANKAALMCPACGHKKARKKKRGFVCRRCGHLIKPFGSEAEEAQAREEIKTEKNKRRSWLDWVRGRS